MTSGPKKRKTSKRRKPASAPVMVSGIGFGDPTAASIPSPAGAGAESNGEVAPTMTPPSRGLENGVLKADAFQLVGAVYTMSGDGNVVELNQKIVSNEAEKVSDPSSLDTHKVEEAENIKDGSIDDHSGEASVDELKKSIYSAETTCVIEQPVFPTKEVRTSDVPIEKMEELALEKVKAAVAEEIAREAAASGLGSPLLASCEPDEKVSLLLGVTIDHEEPDYAEDQLIATKHESGDVVTLPAQVVRKTSWMSCCGLFGVFI